VHARPRALPRNQRYPKRLGPLSNRYHRAGANRSAVTDRKKAIGSVKPMAWAEASGAALPMAPLWVLGSVAAWLSAMPLRLR
jgi:hypothetical protein